jgi:uncharacterized protein with HXXEE motif
MATRTIHSSMPRAWPLLFPVTFLAHIAEEYFGGFPAWSARWLGFTFGAAGFLELNAAAWIVMFVASIVATLGNAWLVVPFATATFVNGCVHLVLTIVTRSYSPGVITGTLFWIPLGAYTLRRKHAELSHAAFWSAAILGLALHALVVFYARFG